MCKFCIIKNRYYYVINPLWFGKEKPLDIVLKKGWVAYFLGI